MKKIAIIGRPNVGKSALFNRILKRRVAIVEEEEGITRDRIYKEGDYFGKKFILIDAGGFDPYAKKLFSKEILEQAKFAIEDADSIVQVVDGKVPEQTLDREIAKLLLKTKKPIFLAVNKVDNREKKDVMITPFFRLGIKQIYPVSALQDDGIEDLLDKVLENEIVEIENEEEEIDVALEISDENKAATDETVDSSKEKAKKEQDARFNKNTKVAIVGRSNVGKSTLLNFLLDENRVAVSPIAGTTRDCVDAAIFRDGKEYLFIDTAGIRRKQKEITTAEKFAHIRTERAIKSSDVCVFMLDVQDGVTAQDKKIANLIEREGKGCLVLINKWDLISGYKMEEVLLNLKRIAPFLEYCPIILGSAKQGRNVEKLFGIIDTIKKALFERVSTGDLNRFLETAMQKYHPPMITGKRLRVYYLTQVKINPPRFLFFVNRKDLFQETYKKYLANQFRKSFKFLGAPLFFEIKPKKKNNKKPL